MTSTKYIGMDGAQGKYFDRSDEFCWEDRDGMCHRTKASMILRSPQQLCAPRHRAEWLRKINEPGCAGGQSLLSATGCAEIIAPTSAKRFGLETALPDPNAIGPSPGPSPVPSRSSMRYGKIAEPQRRALHREKAPEKRPVAAQRKTEILC